MANARSNDMVLYQPAGQQVVVDGLYEVIGLIAAVGVVPPSEAAQRMFQCGDILPTYGGWEVCWYLRRAAVGTLPESSVRPGG